MCLIQMKHAQIKFPLFSFWTVHSWLVFSTMLVNCCPNGRRNYTCVLLPLYLLSDLPPSAPSQTKCTVYTDSVWLCLCVCVGGGGLSCVVGHILQVYRLHTAILDRPPSSAATMEVQGPDTQ